MIVHTNHAGQNEIDGEKQKAEMTRANVVVDHQGLLFTIFMAFY